MLAPPAEARGGHAGGDGSEQIEHDPAEDDKIQHSASIGELAGTAVALSAVMRQLSIPALVLLLVATAACQMRTETQTVTDSTGTHQQQTTTYTTTMHVGPRDRRLSVPS